MEKLLGSSNLKYMENKQRNVSEMCSCSYQSNLSGMKRLFILSSKAFFETALQAESPVMINRFKCECPGYTVSQ